VRCLIARYVPWHCGRIRVVAISTGGIIEGWGPPAHALRNVMREVAQFRQPQGEDDYVIDIAFRLWDPRWEPRFTGVRPGMVGRKQRRFIIWHSVPAGLDDAESVTAWLTAALPETARLVREHLPRKSKAYPIEELATEAECLRDGLLRPDRAGLETRTRRHSGKSVDRGAQFAYGAGTGRPGGKGQSPVVPARGSRSVRK
jgi:hypothetical protein